MEEYKNKGYIVNDKLAPEYPHCKDYNDVLKYLKEAQPELVAALDVKRKAMAR